MLEHLFGSTTRVKLLRLFYTNSERSFFVRELSRLIDAQLNAVRRELMNLESLGIIKQVELGESKEEEIGTERSKYYKVNSGFFLYDELGSLLNKTQIIEEKGFVDMIVKRSGRVKMLILTGFFSNESEVGTDILIVGDIKVIPLAKAIHEFEKFLSRPIRYTVLDEREYAERKEIGDKFLYGIFEGKHITALDLFKAEV